jgi:hypothetical protein
VLKRLRALLEQELARSGSISITKDAGMFEAYDLKSSVFGSPCLRRAADSGATSFLKVLPSHNLILAAY